MALGDLYDATRDMLLRERSTVIHRMETLTQEALDVELEKDGIPPSSFEREHALTAMLHGRLAEIDIALERINDGTYGICADCSQEIPIKRLQVLPFATHCVACQSAADKRLKRRV